MSISQITDERDRLLDCWCSLMLEYFSLPIQISEEAMRRRDELNAELDRVDQAIANKETTIALLQMKRVAA